MVWELQAAITGMMLEYSVKVLTKKCMFSTLYNIHNHVFTMMQDSCENGSVRLVDKVSEREGGVEVCISNLWHTVLIGEAYNGLQEASVACTQLGLSSVGKNICTSPK